MIELAEDIVDNESLRVTIFCLYYNTKDNTQTEKIMLLDLGLTLANKNDIISRRYIR